MRNFPTVFLAAATSFAIACNTRQVHLKDSEIRPLPFGTGLPVNGLRGTVDSARAANVPVRLLLMHGMITSERGYSRPHQLRIAERLKLEQAGTDSVFPIARGYDFTVTAGPQPFDLGGTASRSGERFQSEIRRTTWADRGRPNSIRVIAYELRWAPLRDVVKNRFLACYETGPVTTGFDCRPFLEGFEPNADRQASLNHSLKRGILVKGLADASIVLSPLGNILRDDVDLTMCIIARDELASRGFSVSQPVNDRCDLGRLANNRETAAAAGRALDTARFAAITHSLGSFLLMDQQYHAAVRRSELRTRGSTEQTRETLGFFLLDRKTVFMLANQVSLLGLARLNAICQPADSARRCPNSALRTGDAWVTSPSPLSTMTTWVAFNDANDLLGYELPGYLSSVGTTGSLINVTVRNPGFRFLRTLKDPNAAHTKQADNPVIIEAIVEGFRLPRREPSSSRTP